MTKHDLSNAQELVNLIQELTQEEGSFVEIGNDNPDFCGPDGYDCRITVQQDYVDDKTYYGETVISCLNQAKEARK